MEDGKRNRVLRANSPSSFKILCSWGNSKEFFLVWSTFPCRLKLARKKRASSNENAFVNGYYHVATKCALNNAQNIMRFPNDAASLRGEPAKRSRFKFYGTNIFESWFALLASPSSDERRRKNYEGFGWRYSMTIRCYLLMQIAKRRGINSLNPSEPGVEETFRKSFRLSNVATSLLCYNHIFHLPQQRLLDLHLL